MKQDEIVIRVEDIHKVYDLGETKVHALRGVTLEIRRGEFVAIMGASGSGKSTFMNILGCLDKPSSGRYLLDGKDVSRLDKSQLAGIRNRQIGFVFQGFNLLARTTALENTELPTLYSRVDKAERQRRALVNRPSLLLADEPTGNLDSRTSVEVMEILQSLNDKGLTIVLVTHEHDIAHFARRSIAFRDGTIRRDEPIANRARAAEVLKTLPVIED